MTLRTRLMTVMLACGLVPLAIYGVISYLSASSGLTSITEKGQDALTGSSKEQLVSLREVKKTQVHDYFETIRKQIQTFSENQMVVDSLRDMNVAFHNFREEQKLDEGAIAKQQRELLGYYTQDFADEYKSQNSGTHPNVDKHFRLLDDDAIAFQYQYVRANSHPLGSKHELDRSPVESRYNELHGKAHPIIRNYLEQFGYYDIFLVDSESGDIVYSVFKELDYGTSLLDGPVADTNFGEVFRRGNKLSDPNDFVLVEFEQYMPSYEAPASFIASPIFDGDKRLGVAIFQMPLDTITGIMGERDGLGETGETMLVGPDYLPRSDSFRDAENRTVVGAFRNSDDGRIETESTQAVFKDGDPGITIETDYVGNETITAYTPIDILGLNWALLAKRDVSDALQAIGEIEEKASSAQASIVSWAFGLVVLCGVAVGLVAFYIARTITDPIVRASEFAREIASGRLMNRCEVEASGEVGTLIDSMNDMRDSLRNMICKLTSNVSTLSNSSTQLSEAATNLSEGADQTTTQSSTVNSAAAEMSNCMTNVSASTSQMSGHVITVAAAVEEMTASITDVSQNADRAAGVAGEAARLTEVSNAKVEQLGNAADEIGKVIEVIQDIAEQTNLLALNATIEAARAGDAGKGFAVVATEVKELARQTSEATGDIAKRIKAIQESTGEAITAIGEIEGVIRNVSEVSRTIATAVAAQQDTSHEIANTVNETTSAVQTVSAGIADSTTACQEIRENMEKVDQAARNTSSGASVTRSAGDELLTIAEELRELVSEFAVDEKECAVA